MGEERQVDVIRWTFTANPERREAIEDYLTDLGLDVSARDGGQFVALWDEPAGDTDFDAVVETLWELNGASFEITHEVFGRLEMLVFHSQHESDGEERAVA